MKYSDRQRVQKIYDYAIRLQAYLRKICLTEYENTGDC